MMRRRLRIVIVLTMTISIFAVADVDTVKIDPGAGAEYELAFQQSNSKVAIYFAKPPAPRTKAVEMYFSTGPIQLWQRFHLRQASSGQMQVKDGFIHSSMFQTRKLEAEYLKGFDGVQMSQFLLSSKAELARHFVGSEDVTIPAGKVKADHYRMQRAGQTIDFWIHHQAKPIGLVKLISTGSDPKHNYTMRMTKLLKNVGEKIDPSQAQPMDEKTRSFLPKPKSGGGGFGLM